MTIKNILNDLPKHKRDQLMQAFEHEYMQIVDLGDGKFLGVNVLPSPSIEIIEQAGAWTYAKRSM